MTKAKSKSAKRKQRAGRPRIENVDRTPSGQISRSRKQTEEREKDIKGVVIQMRQRQHGTTATESPEWGYVLGRIYLDGTLGTVRQPGGEKGLAEMRLDAGNEYAMDVARYYSLTGIPFPSARAQSLLAVRGYDGDVTEEKAQMARSAANRIMKLEGVLLKCEEGRNVASAVKSVCVMDIDEARMWPAHMHRHLIRGLDAMIFHNRLASERKSG